MHESRGTKFRTSVAHHNTSAENGTETWETKLVIDKKKRKSQSCTNTWPNCRICCFALLKAPHQQGEEKLLAVANH